MQATFLLNVREVAAKLGITRGTVYKILDRDPTFPRPIYPGIKSPRWRVDELDAWLDRLSAARAA